MIKMMFGLFGDPSDGLPAASAPAAAASH